MRKKIILRLSLLTVFLALLWSCRNDYLPDQQETHTSNSLFQLTSKILSLKESRHAASISPGILKAETVLKNMNSGLSGKTFSYGNGVSIDTDHVIYIENGPGYHTYTFNIIREGASENAPLENLVLSPLSDGTYRELLFSYSLTSAEKQNMANGIPVDTKGRVSVTELTQGTYNTGGQLGKTSCGWAEETIWVTCSQGIHGQHNWWEWHECTATVPPKVYTVVRYKCMTEADGGSTGGSDHTDDPPTGGGGDNEGSNDTPDNTCNGTGVLTQPQQPGFTDADGCTGIPTQPNFPNPSITNPCDKTKAMLAKPNVQQGINSIKAQALSTLGNVYAGEIGFKEKKDGTIVPADVNSNHKVVYNDVTDGYGGYHNHTATGTHMFSPPDITETLFGFAAAQNNVEDAYFGMIAAEWCSTCPNNVQYIHYVIQYTGAATDLGTGGSYNFTSAQMTQFLIDYRKKVNKLLKDPLYSNNNGAILNNIGLEKLFFDTLKNIGINGKVNLQRIESNGVIKNITENSNGTINANPCP